MNTTITNTTANAPHYLVTEETRFYPETNSYSTTTCYGTVKGNRFLCTVEYHAMLESATMENYLVDELGNGSVRLTKGNTTLVATVTPYVPSPLCC